MSTETFKKAAAIVSDAKKKVNELLTLPVHSHALLGANQQLDNLINRFTFLSGGRPASTKVTETKPVTNFMGKKIVRPEKVKQSDLAPEASKKEALLKKVQQLYDGIRGMDPATVLDSYKMPEDVVALRGVAKRAGVKNYADAELNEPFIEEIQEGVAAKEALKAGQKKIDDSLKDDSKKPGAPVAPKAPTVPVNKTAVKVPASKNTPSKEALKAQENKQ